MKSLLVVISLAFMAIGSCSGCKDQATATTIASVPFDSVSRIDALAAIRRYDTLYQPCSAVSVKAKPDSAAIRFIYMTNATLDTLAALTGLKATKVIPAVLADGRITVLLQIKLDRTSGAAAGQAGTGMEYHYFNLAKSKAMVKEEEPFCPPPGSCGSSIEN